MHRGFCFFVAFFLAPMMAHSAIMDDVDEVMKEAGVVYETSIEIPCEEEMFLKVVDDLSLAGALWRAYGFAPSYEVSGMDDSVHVSDPTGLEGDVLLAEKSDSTRVYFARGRVSHWAFPFLNSGKAVFRIVTSESDVGIEVFLVSSDLPRSMLRVVSPLIRAHIRNRLILNMADFFIILQDIEAKPEEVANRLQVDIRRRFEILFLK